MAEEDIKTDYYIKMKLKLMEQFNHYLQTTKKILIKKFTEDKTEELIKLMKNEFENLIPEIPYIGGLKNPYTTMMIYSIGDLAIIRILEKEGFTYREIGGFYYELSENIYKIRKGKLEKMGQNPIDQYFNKAYVNIIKSMTEKSQNKQFPYDWVWEFVDGDGKTFDYGLKVTECGIHKLYKKLGAEKYVPFICLSDFTAANIYGFGFTRTQTLGNGDPLCDHRYIEKGKTPRAWPPDNLQEYKME